MTRIAFDLDDVLGNHTPQFICFHERVYPTRRRLHLEMFRSYDLAMTLEINPEELYGLLNRFYESPEFEDISPTYGSQNYIQKLREEVITMMLLGPGVTIMEMLNSKIAR